MSEWEYQTASNIAEEVTDLASSLETAVNDEDKAGAQEGLRNIRAKLVQLDKELAEIPDYGHDVAEPAEENDKE